MRLNYSIAITLGLMTFLSALMLGLGQAGFMLPVLMFVAAVSSFYLTDYKHLIRLGDWTVNVLVLAIVFLAFGELLKNRGEDTAFSIARVLVFVEMVLLFREKVPRFCWQILIISLLQVLVATVFQQSLFFGFLLLAYVFTGLCAFVMIFLQQENLYFRRHSFVNTFWDALKSEIAERQDRGKLVRIALVTLLTGPLSIVFSFSNSETGKKRFPWGPQEGGDATAREILRSLFAVFPQDQEILAKNRWETVESAETNLLEEELDECDFEKSAIIVIAQKELAQVPDSSVISFRGTQKTSRHASHRFPLLADRPSFSAGTVVPDGLEGGQGELLRHLLRGTFFALIVAILLFCFVPRIGRIDFANPSFRWGPDYWASATIAPVSSVGFTEEIRLGSLGTVLPYHREVMSVRFTKFPEGRMPKRDETVYEVPYDEIQGAALYFRGVSLDTYADGTWTTQREPEHDPFSQEKQEEILWRQEIHRALLQGLFHVLRPGSAVQPSESNKLFFENGTDMVAIQMTIQPLNTRVFFAPWPFFRRSDSRSTLLNLHAGRVEEARQRQRATTTTIYTTAFKHGTQCPFIPCQERIPHENLLQVPEEGLDSLKNLARRWDQESGLPAEDISGRAKFMEQKFLTSGQFSYKLGGIVRDFNSDPLEDFVGNNPSGHCEYFAGALALMLRCVGIPSRVIVGYKSFATGSQGTMIRQSDAHAWVEAFLSPEMLSSHDAHSTWWQYGGWLRLDPSPSTETTLMETFSFSLTDIKQWIQTAWNEAVLNMNSSKQTEWIYTPVRNAFRFLIHEVLNYEFWKNSARKMFSYGRSLLSDPTRSRWGVPGWFQFTGLVCVVLCFAGALTWLLRGLGVRWAVFSQQERRRRATIEFYVRLEKMLARVGPPRRSGETPLEYARNAFCADCAVPVVDLYYRVRFGGQLLTDEQIAAVRATLDQIEKKDEKV